MSTCRIIKTSIRRIVGVGKYLEKFKKNGLNLFIENWLIP